MNFKVVEDDLESNSYTRPEMIAGVLKNQGQTTFFYNLNLSNLLGKKSPNKYIQPDHEQSPVFYFGITARR